MKASFTYKAKGQRGFTLVELVVVIAIIGVLSAVAVPFIASHLGESKDRAYEVDRERLQQAVAAFYSRPSNIHYLGKPQYPIMGMDKTTRTFVKESHKHDKEKHQKHTKNHNEVDGKPHDHTVILTELGNPLGGTQGGSPQWIDGPLPGGNGIRDGVEEELLDNDELSLDKPAWHVATINRQGTRYIVDSRDYFIDFTKLEALGLLEEVPLSASPDNKPKDPPQSIALVSGNGKAGGLTITPPTSTLGVSLWVVDEGSNQVFQYSLQGVPLDGGFPLSPENGKAKGITTDGESFWVVDREDEKVYRYDLDVDGIFRESHSFPLNSPDHPDLRNLEGIAYLGTSLWILDREDGLFRYNTAGDYQGEFVTFSSVKHPEGITTDGDQFWVVDQDDGVYQFTLTGDPIGVPFSVPPAGHPEGIATDGTNLWVVDKDPTERIYPFGLQGGPPEPVTGLYTGSYSWYVDPDGKVKSLFFYLPEPDSIGFQTAYP